MTTTTNTLDAKIPGGPLAEKWSRHKFETKLVSPNNKPKFTIIVVGTGLAGASAASSLSELGYRVKSFCLGDTPRRAHSISAQGGINAAKNYPNDGDSVRRLFYDTIKGGDFRAREANVHRLAEVSGSIIDQCVAQGVPFTRDYAGYLDNRSFGGAQVSRTFYANGQTGQQLLLGAYGALMKEVARGNVELNARREMLDLIVADNRAVGIICRNLVSGAIETHMADAVIIATGGYANVFYLSTNSVLSNATAAWRAHKRGAFFANPCFTQIHPTCIPVSGEYQSKLTLMSEGLRNDGRIWVPRAKNDPRTPGEIPKEERWYYLEERYPSFGNLVPRDVASRAAKHVCDDGYGVGGGYAVYLDFKDALEQKGKAALAEKYGNLFEMYERITDEDPNKTPMRIYPAVHYTMGGLWVDYNLMGTIPGLFVIGEANFSDHGANRLGASALMQGLADGYFVLPYTIGGFLASAGNAKATDEHPAARDAQRETQQRLDKLIALKGAKTVREVHRELGLLLWNNCGMARTADSLRNALQELPALRDEFWHNVNVLGSPGTFNQVLEAAGRMADFLELAELICKDALQRNESCGSHLREEYQTEDGEPRRNDDEFCYVAAWEYKGGSGESHTLHKEPLTFDEVKLVQRSYA
jgi:succinate dehydrogenase / fumarate reductase flavoprotein subunit